MPDVLFQNSNTILASAGGSDTLSGTKTINAGVNLCAICYVVWNDVNEGITILSAKYNAVPMTAMGTRVRVGTTNLQYIQGFYLPNPATGGNILEIIFSNPNALDQGAVLLAYVNVDQVTPLRGGSYTNFSGLTDADGKKLLAISSQASDRTISCSGNNDSAPLSSQTLETSDTAGSTFLGTDDGPGSATVNHIWDTIIPSANQIGLLAASLAAAPSTDKTPYVPYQQQQPILAQ